MSDNDNNKNMAMNSNFNNISEINTNANNQIINEPFDMNKAMIKYEKNMEELKKLVKDIGEEYNRNQMDIDINPDDAQEQKYIPRKNNGPNYIFCKICKKVNCHYTNKCPNLICKICLKSGHSTKNCPLLYSCQICGELSHPTEACNTEEAMLIRAQKYRKCLICGNRGHIAKYCGNIKHINK